MFKLDLEKAEEPEIKFPTSIGSSKKPERSRNASLLLYWIYPIFITSALFSMPGLLQSIRSQSQTQLSSWTELNWSQFLLKQPLQPFATPWTAAYQASLSFTISWSVLKLMSIESVMSSNCHILCCPLIFLPSNFPSIKVFSNESALHIKSPKYWNFSFSIIHSFQWMNVQGLFPLGLTDWFDFPSCPRVSRVFSSTTVQKHQFFGTQHFVCSNSLIRTWILVKSEFWLYRLLLVKWFLCFLICSLGLS